MKLPTTAPIYLDYHTTTPVDPRVAAVVLHAMTTAFGNANSKEHIYAEDDIRARLDVYAAPELLRPFSYQPSAVQGLVTRRDVGTWDFLAALYTEEDNSVYVATSCAHPSSSRTSAIASPRRSSVTASGSTSASASATVTSKS